MIPKEVTDAIEKIVAAGKDVLLKKEHGKWVVLESTKHIVYKEK